jgi:DNA-damage-inducible protein J
MRRQLQVDEGACASIPNEIQLSQDNHKAMTAKSAMIRARIEPKTKDAAEEILKSLGVNPTEAISMFYYQIILRKGIPFSVSLEAGDTPENYTEISSNDELKSLLNL